MLCDYLMKNGGSVPYLKRKQAIKCDEIERKMSLCPNPLLKHNLKSFTRSLYTIAINFDSSRQSTIAVSLLDNTDMELVVDGRKWNITASQNARNTINPIRRIVDKCKVMPNADKPLISLSIGKIHVSVD